MRLAVIQVFLLFLIIYTDSLFNLKNIGVIFYLIVISLANRKLLNISFDLKKRMLTPIFLGIITIYIFNTVVSTIISYNINSTSTNYLFEYNLSFFVLGIIIMPILEEVFFRSFLLRTFLNKMKLWPAILISSAIFATAHFTYESGLIYVFITGCFISWCFTMSKNKVIYCILAHSIYNLLFFLASPHLVNLIIKLIEKKHYLLQIICLALAFLLLFGLLKFLVKFKNNNLNSA